MCNVRAWRHSRLHAHWLMALVREGGGVRGRSMFSAFPRNCSVSYLSFVYGRSLWAVLNGGENSLHWKANMLPLFSIRTLWLRTQLEISQVYLEFYDRSCHFSNWVDSSLTVGFVNNSWLKSVFYLQSAIAKQPCERLIVSPRRQIIMEGSLHLLENNKPQEMYVILFDDMLLITRRKKGLSKKVNWPYSKKKVFSVE